MRKYDKMVANNQAASREKIDCARKAILLLLEEEGDSLRTGKAHWLIKRIFL